MVDNFDIIRKILRFDHDGECYYVQLLRRAADDPKQIISNGVDYV